MTSLRNLGIIGTLLLAAGCGGKVDEYGGETHWLGTCSPSKNCGDGLECWCGVCTVTCTTQSQCADVDDDAVCGAREQLNFAAQCDGSPSAKVPLPDSLCVRQSNLSGAASDASTPSADVDASTPNASTSPSAISSAKPDASPMLADSVSIDGEAPPTDAQAPIEVADAADDACANVSPSSGCSSNEADAGGDREHSLELRLQPTFEDSQVEPPRTWYLNAKLELRGSEVTGWLAGSGVTLLEDDPGYPATLPITAGSVAVQGRLEGGALVFESLNIPFFNTQSRSLQFDSLSLVVKDNGQVEGSGAGRWLEIQGDQGFSTEFEATLEGTPDETSPIGTVRGTAPLTPIDSITVYFNEPSFLGTEAIVEDESFTVTSRDDPSAGMVDAITLTPANLWQDSVSIHVGVTDYAGNQANQTLPALPIFQTPNSDTNIDFEQGNEEWLGNFSTITRDQLLSEGTDAPIDAGDELAFLQGGERLVGYLIAPLEAQEFCFWPNTHYAGTLGTALQVRLVTTEDTVSKSFSIEELHVSESDPIWTGWSLQCVPLPSGSQDGFWVEVQRVLFAPQLSSDTALDNITFR